MHFLVILQRKPVRSWRASIFQMKPVGRRSSYGPPEHEGSSGGGEGEGH